MAPRGSISADVKLNPRGSSSPEDGVVVSVELANDVPGWIASTIWPWEIA
jgi:hypothetical protein